MDELVKKILTSRVYEVVRETLLDESESLSQKLGNRVRLKREDQQPIFSFKIRGAYNRLAHLTDTEKSKGVVAASAGNHAQGVAYSGRMLGIDTLIVMPVTTPAIKVEAVRNYGGTIILHGDSYSEAAEHARVVAREQGRVFIHPFDDELVIAGQGTVGDEIIRQNPGALDAIFVPVGGGGLIAGIGAYVKELRPEVKIIGVEPVDSPTMLKSLEAGKIVELEYVGAFADGVAVKKAGERTFAICQGVVDEIVTVNTDELCSGIKTVFQATRSIVEPAGGLAMAGLQKYARQSRWQGKTMVAVLSGANMNFERLRFVAERTLIGEKQEALYAVTIPEKPGSLKRFCHEQVGERNITEFNYRLSERDRAQIFVGITVSNDEDRISFKKQLIDSGFDTLDLTDDELAKNHIRYMVGGRSANVQNERLYRFWFPERPGALVRFLDATRGRRNISLFHYRAQGGDYGRVLVGFEVADCDKKDLDLRLQELGYRFVEETDNPAYRLFL
ncbi:MAG: threonine ammonia-lyase, biosynthetic [Desulfobulbaceae bacterium]|nr:MAG: threonine ammonia-lyase, biosynthetic [Desulfobulbaceae bacterium]